MLLRTDRLLHGTAFLFATLTALSVLSGCRLGANNTDKLQALQSGEVYDEDGVIAVSITSPAADALINLASNSSAYAVSGTCAPDGAPITIAVDASVDSSGTVPVCAQGLWTTSFDAASLADGTHSLTAQATHNGKSKSSEPVKFTKNVAIPDLAILTPVQYGYINSSSDSATFAVSGTCSEADRSVTLTLDEAAASSQVGGICNGATWAATISTLSLSAGAHTLQANTTSSSGNPKTSTPVIVTKDIVAPTAAITTPAASSFINIGNNSASFAVSGTCNDSGASVQVKVDGSNSGTAASCSGVNWNTTISTVALAQGAHSLNAVITDAAGNSATSSAVSITKDTVAPSIAVTSPATNSFINIGNNSTTFAVSGSCATASESGRSITLQINGANATQSAIACGASDAWSGTINTTGLSQGSHTLTALLTDAAGNASTSTAVALTKDTVAPSVTLTTPVSGLTLTSQHLTTTYAVKGTCSENSAAVTLKVDGSAASGVASNTCSSGSFNATIDVTGLSNAAHTITATQTDSAGNTGPGTPPSTSFTQNAAQATGGTFGRASVATDPWSGVQAASGVARYLTTQKNYADMLTVQNYAAGNLSALQSYYSVSGSKITASSQPTSGPLPGWKVAIQSGETLKITGTTDLSTVYIYWRGYDAAGTAVFAQTNITPSVTSGSFSTEITMGNYPTLSYINIGVGNTTVTSFWMDNLVIRHKTPVNALLIEESTTNLISDGSFESGNAPSPRTNEATGGGTTWASTAVSDAACGSRVLRITREDGDHILRMWAQTINATQVTISGRVRRNGINNPYGSINDNAPTSFTLSLWNETSGASVGTVASYNGTQLGVGSGVGNWVEFKKTLSITSGSNYSLRFYHSGYTNGEWLLDYDCLQMEAKGAMTSYAEGTRAAESMVVPMNGSLQANQGAVVMRAYVDGDLAATTSSKLRCLWDTQNAGSGWNGIQLCRLGTGSNAWLVQTSNATQYTDLNFTKSLAAGWHVFGVKWTASRVEIWVDGASQGGMNTPYLPTSQNSMFIGCNYHSNGYCWGQPIDYAAFYQIAPADAEMVTYTSTGPTGADNRLDFHSVAFTRDSVANAVVNGAQAASGIARYHTSGASTGIVIEEATTNLLTANMSNVETDITGFGASGGTASISRSTTWAREGVASLKVDNAISTGATIGTAYAGAISFTSGTTYAMSAYIYNPNSTSITIKSGIAGNETGTFAIPAGEVKRIEYTWTSDFTSTASMRFGEYSGPGKTFYVDQLQIEQKAYVTSWQVGGTARTAESVAIPSSNTISGSSGKIRMRFMFLRTPGSATIQSLFDVGGGGTVNGFFAETDPTTSKIHLKAGNGSALQSASSSTVFTSNTWYTIEAAWSASQISLAVNGSVEATTNMTPSITPNTLVRIGNMLDTKHMGGVVDYVELEYSDGSVKRLDFNGSLGQ